ncbi:carboxypeptidase-like regulatory domain-containing protein [Sinomicrobium weinanense]|uniref:Carboxypeptidase-like regulatory domain-containing protein n=1 Tax=Sinomicrobium weinanense TaxID=2842200 RepID=A0A926JUX5_9FLAO|nr:carboxypeptidase-like regulatory domain-containing protein [Sinomicrobium weinanense]MBC9797646.1 carboxypeptidase-like regulatory domain-containing protein [Sinomicrobium weinanense]MBU3122672.1 carboxypeptidase-like regulatory domain-containing protein [Sinomicrobium weinanense]
MAKKPKTYHSSTSDCRKKLAVFLFVLPFSLCDLYAQNNLKGKVESLSSDVEGVHVINKTTNTATITNSQGFFSIPAASGDTLLFSAVQFREKEIVISGAHTDQFPLIVELEEQVTELDEVILKNLTGNLTSDLRNARTDSVNAMSLGLPNAHIIPRTKSERKLYAATDLDFDPLRSISIKIDPLINILSGRTKKLKNRLYLENKTTQLEKIHTRYGEEFFISSGIVPEKIYDFLYFCSVQPEYDRIIKANDRMALSRFLKVQAVRYKEVNDPSATKD